MLARRRRQGADLPAMVQLAERRRGQAPAPNSARHRPCPATATRVLTLKTFGDSRQERHKIHAEYVVCAMAPQRGTAWCASTSIRSASQAAPMHSARQLKGLLIIGALEKKHIPARYPRAAVAPVRAGVVGLVRPQGRHVIAGLALLSD